MSSLMNGVYHRIRHRSARSVADEPRTVRGFDHLRHHRYCVLVSYKRNGEPVPTPVWFGLGDGNLYVRSEADVAKVRRIRNDSRVRVAPSTVRGRPLGPPAEGHARLLDAAADQQRAEAALRANYGLGRRVYERVGSAFAIDTVYLEIAPA
jgi:PPOX class probable F420-dependent enzyme